MKINKEGATLKINDREIKLDVIQDNADVVSVDISSLRSKHGIITYDPGFANTGASQSSICFVDGEKGILRYRGYDIEDLVDHCDFVEVAHLLVKEELPNRSERLAYQDLLNKHSLLHTDMQMFYRSYPQKAHPMGILSAMVASLSAFYPELENDTPEDHLDLTVTRLLSKMRTIAAFTYRQSIGQDTVNPSYKYSYCENFLHMMFDSPVYSYVPDPKHVDALNKLLILHADHEQNCSTSAVRLVGSSAANLYASVSAGCCALWGKKHGGANQAVLEMLQEVAEEGWSIEEVIEKSKNKKDHYRLAGFGHRVYKTYDPRAKIAKKLCADLLGDAAGTDPLLNIALELEEKALKDPYFIEKNLYPNIDFYTGIIFHYLGIPSDMFTVMFALGRLPGWIAHYLEWKVDPYQKIGRPRQVYTGPSQRVVLPIDQR